MTIGTGPYMTTEAPIADVRTMLVALRKPDGTLSFPGLSRECPRHEGQAHTEHKTEDGSRCIDGRVDAVTLEAVMEYGGTITWTFEPHIHGLWWCGIFQLIEDDDYLTFSATGSTPLDAATRALAAATEAAG